MRKYTISGTTYQQYELEEYIYANEMSETPGELAKILRKNDEIRDDFEYFTEGLEEDLKYMMTDLEREMNR